MPDSRDRSFFGHPAGLSTLFFTEMWERLSYYGMRAFLFIYMTTALTKGGRGMSDASAGLVMALYMSSVYLLSLPGGWIADRFLGQRRAVSLGAIGIILGNGLLAMPIEGLFYPGLVMIALGTGLLKPNISTIVGQLYTPDDDRRDSGYTIYYMGINIGALFAPIVCGFLAQSDTFREFLLSHDIDPSMCWKFAFAAPAVGMAFGLVQYLIGYTKLGDAGLHPTIPDDPRAAAGDRQKLVILIGLVVAIVASAVVITTTGVIEIDGDTVGDVFGIGLAIGAFVLFFMLLRGAKDADEKKRITAMIPLFLGSIGFFGVFEQASTTLSAFAERLVHREWMGMTIQASYYQIINSLFVIGLAPLFAYIWVALARARREPGSVSKFAIGMVFTGLSFVILLPTVASITGLTDVTATLGTVPFAGDAVNTVAEPMRVTASYLFGVYFFSTLAELCISPVGLSSMSKLAPRRMAGMVMGTWFLGTAIGNYLAGRAAGFSESRGYAFLFNTLIISSLVISAALFLVAPIVRRMMASSGTEGPEGFEAPAIVEPEPLPKATVVKGE